MQQQINSYTFQLNQNLDKSVLECHYSQPIFYMSARQKDRSNSSKQSSYLYKLNFEQQNPRKSQIKKQSVNGNIQQIISYSKQSQNLLLVIKQSSKYHIKQTQLFQSDNQLLKLINIFSSQQQISLIHDKHSKRFFITKFNSIDIMNQQSFQIQQNVIKLSDKQKQITSFTIDPIHELLTYVVDQKEIIVTDKHMKNDKYTLKIGKNDLSLINSIDYNPNKQYYLMSCHNQCLKFWDIRKPNLPIKVYLDHHSIVLNAKYNPSHDQLICCSYDDGTIGLLRMNSVSSVPADNQDTIIKLYDQHQDSLYNIKWTNFSPWIFASLSYNASNVVVNFVPSVEKYRILL